MFGRLKILPNSHSVLPYIAVLDKVLHSEDESIDLGEVERMAADNLEGVLHDGRAFAAQDVLNSNL